MNHFKTRMRFFISLGIAIHILYTSNAQVENNLFNLDYVPQTQFVNPASRPNTNWHFGFGALFNSSWPLSYNDVISKKTNDTVYINGGNLISKLGANNHFNASLIPDFSLGFGIKKGYFTFGMKENIVMNLSVPKDVVEFLINGNGQPNTIGTFQNIGNFQLNGMHYREIFLGGSYPINPKWGVGGRLKYLIGYENIQTVKSELSIMTDPNDYSMSMKSNYLINTSGLNSNYMDKYNNGIFASSGNSGFGIDLGANYKLNDQFSFSGSIIDLGFISWSDKNKIMRSKNENATYQYSGIDLYNLSSNNQSTYIDVLLDSVRKKFDLEEVANTQSYSTSLFTKLYLGGTYKLNKKFDIGALSSFTLVNGAVLPALSMFAKTNLYKIAQLQLSYQINQNSFANLGMGFAINLGPIQYYLVSDNIVGTAFSPLSSKNVSIRTGINFQWSYGKTKEPNFTMDTSKKIAKSNAIAIDMDRDKDSVVDSLDFCIDIPGSKMNKGCPEGADISRLSNNEILIFEPNSEVLYPTSIHSYNMILQKLNDSPATRLFIQIRSLGSELEKNERIGLTRLKTIMNKLTESGIAISRLNIINKNTSDPIGKSASSYDLMLNRSAEMKIITIK
jgi:hypothetical protein